MLKKYKKVKWSVEARLSFERIKKALIEAPMLVSPDFTKEFSMFSFASENTIVFVLLQKNYDDLEQTVSFFSKILRGSYLKYSTMKNQAYILVKALKFFRNYVLHSKIIAYVPNIAVK